MPAWMSATCGVETTDDDDDDDDDDERSRWRWGSR